MTEASFLKEELGPILALGLAETTMARPRDPVEFLGRWLLHHIEEKERVAQQQQVQQQLEKEKEQWAHARMEREKFSSTVIQREWKSHTTKAHERKQKESLLVEHFNQVAIDADEKYNPEDAQLPEGERTEQEKEIELARLHADVAFQRSKFFLDGLTKENIADIKAIASPPEVLVRIIRCIFYLMGRSPRQVDSWSKMVIMMKPFPFLEWMRTYNPCTPLDRKRKICRVRRLLKSYSEELVKNTNGGITVFVLYQWLQGVTDFRDARDADVKAKKAAGKDTGDEEFEEEEVLEDEEKDGDEEIVRKEEEEEAKRIAEEEAAAAAEAAADGAAAEE